MSTNIELPTISHLNDEKVALTYNGDLTSHLLALLLIEKYGVEKVVFLLNLPKSFSKISGSVVADDKYEKIKSNFLQGIEKLNGSHIVENGDDLIDQHYKIFDKMKAKVEEKFKNVKYYFGAESIRDTETLSFLVSSGWSTGERIYNELLDFLEEHKTDYPELYNYTTNFYKKPPVLPSAGLDYINRKYFYDSYTKPFINLTEVEIVALYKEFNLQDKIKDTISCHIMTENNHCQNCYRCQYRNYLLTQAGLT